MDPVNTSLEDAVHKQQLFNSEQDAVDSNVDSVVTQIKQTLLSNGKIEGNNVNVFKEEEVEIVDETDKSRTKKDLVKNKNKNSKLPSPRGLHTSSVASSVSNGTSTLDTHPRQPVKNRAVNDKQTRLTKHSGKTDAASTEAPMEKTRPHLIKKEPLDNLPGKAESSSPTSEDAKPRRVGTMPTYGFSFKCNERAERRKEFYSKLEERIHAKEVEESNIQAKTKESQEAEIKRLRKKLAFKATPMPSFYQEPTPSRVELKKAMYFLLACRCPSAQMCMHAPTCLTWAIF